MDTTNLKVYLPFDNSPTQDLIGNTWTATGDVEIVDGTIHLPSGAYLTANNIFDLNADKWTFSAKIFIASSSNSNGFLGLGEGTKKRGIIVGNDGIYIANSSGSDWQTKKTSLFPNVKNKWVHIEIDKDGSDLKFFQDGTLFWQTTISTLSDTGTLLLGGNAYGNSNDIYFDEFMIYDGVALHTENFTPPTDSDYTNLKLDLGANVPVAKIFDVETSIRNAAKGWRVYNPGEAELLSTGGTTVTVPETQSITGKAFYGGQLSDMFHTPDGLKEIWLRFDFTARDSRGRGNSDCYPRVGHFSNSANTIFGMSSSQNWNGSYNNGYIAFNGVTVLYPALNQIYHCLLHIKSDSTDGLVELTLDKENFIWTGNINGGEDLNNLVIRSTGSDLLFSNVVVSETQLTLEDGWHKRYFGVETKINAPVLNIRLRGENKKFPLNTKRDDKSLTVRVGNRNFYNTSVSETDSLAGSARFLLDDTARALKKG